MSIYGNPITLGGGEDAKIFGVQIGFVNTNSIVIIPTVATELSDENYFTLSNKVFTCTKAGSYKITISVKGCYNTSGTRIDATAYAYVNGSSKANVTSSGTGYYSTSYTTTLSVGDTVELRAKASASGTNREPIHIIISEQS